MYKWIAVACFIGAWSCSSHATNNTHNHNNQNDHGPPDLGTDAEPDDLSELDQPPDEDDGIVSQCQRVSVDLDSFRLSYADDVAVEYSAVLEPDIDGQARELSFLFERYADSEFIGTFELGVGADGNFGTCTHCLFVRGNSVERAYFADAGNFVSNTDPYSRKADFALDGLRLIEVAVDPFTRESVPLRDGRCLEIAAFEVVGTFPVDGWNCPVEQYDDGAECNCECGAYDPDCGVEVVCLPDEPGCTPRPALPVQGCGATEVCAFDIEITSTRCTEPCDWARRDGCDAGTCVFEMIIGEGDLCVFDGPRLAPDVGLGEACPQNIYQVFCNIVDGFVQGYCGPEYTCRPLCERDSDCPVAGETCRAFNTHHPLGYCGPEPVDG